MRTTTIPVPEASTRLPELIALAAQGEQVVLSSGDRPVAQLISLIAPVTGQKRVFGQFHGKIHLSDDFDDPLPDDFWADIKE